MILNRKIKKAINYSDKTKYNYYIDYRQSRVSKKIDESKTRRVIDSFCDIYLG